MKWRKRSKICQHCGSDCKVSALHPDMPFEDFEKVLRRVKESYDSHHISIVVTGGEPLMRQDIVRCGRRMYDMEFPWGMVSNGMLMTDRKIDELLGAGMRAATISLDGLEQEHEWMRTGECADCKYWKYCHGNGLHLRDDNGNLIQCNLKRYKL